MRALLMAVGAYLFILGGSLVALSSLTTSYGLFSVAASQLDAINLGLKMAVVGLVLAPIGAAILAYGIGASHPKGALELGNARPPAPGQAPNETKAL